MEPASDFYYSQPGFRGNLSASQSQALFKLWRRFLRLCQTSASSGATSSADRALKGQPNEPYSASSSASASNDKVYGNAPADYPSTNEALPPQDDRLKDHLRSLEENKDLEAFLRTHGGAALKREFWGMVKVSVNPHFHTSWSLSHQPLHSSRETIQMLSCSGSFEPGNGMSIERYQLSEAPAPFACSKSHTIHPLSVPTPKSQMLMPSMTLALLGNRNNVSQLLKDSELGLTKTVGGMNIFRNGISYIVGATPTGEPVYIIEVGSHYSSNQTAEELKKGVIFLQECLSMMMPPPVERKVVIFNLNNFGLRNMDWGIVLFMAKTMESFYPETLSRVYVHGAPWIFKPIWSILRPLLDPVVRDKIRLTWKVEELAEYVPADRLPKTTMHGDLDREFAYLPPDPSENDVQKDLESYERYRMTYLGVVSQYEDATRTLAKLYSSVPDFKKRSVGSRIGSKLGKHKDDTQSLEDWEPEGMAALKANRDVLATKLRVAWLRLKPYVVGKTSYERRGILRVDGTVGIG